MTLIFLTFHIHYSFCFRLEQLYEKKKQIDRTDLEKAKKTLADLKSKDRSKREIENSETLEIIKKTEAVIQELVSLKANEREIDLETRDLKLELQRLKAKPEMRMYNNIQKKNQKRAKKDKFRQKALDIVKESVRIYGQKNLKKILNNEVSK